MRVTERMAGKMRGVFFSIDSAAALLVTMIITAGVISALVIADQPADSALALSRLARDVYEVKNANPSLDVDWVKTSCAGEANIAVENALEYDAASDSVTRYAITVC